MTVLGAVNSPGVLLEIQEVESVEINQCAISAVFLTFQAHDRRSCRIYAENCLPASDAQLGDHPVPAVLHCPGGGQTVNRNDLLFWGQRGFACASFDWQIGCEKHDPTRKASGLNMLLPNQANKSASNKRSCPWLFKLLAGCVIDWLVLCRRLTLRRLAVWGSAGVDI